MPEYRRNRVAGGSYFFTVNLLDRRRGLLVERIEALRAAVRDVRRSAPFHVDAWVVLPEHMHCVWTLPEGDDDFFRPVATDQGGVCPWRERRRGGLGKPAAAR